MSARPSPPADGIADGDDGAVGALPVSQRWLDAAASLRSDFEAADPFPHLVLDGFLDEDLAQRLHEEFPGPDAMPRSRDYVFGHKHELSSVERAGPAGAEMHAAVTSPAFARLLRTMTGFDLFVDPAFHGGGYHLGTDGGYLDMHVDFNVHPLHQGWLRTLNILLYLNHDWRPEYGGQLLLKAAPDATPIEIEPIFNRAVVMLTSDTTYHGFRRLSLPPGATRRSIATYAYRRVDPGTVLARTTGWSPDGAPMWKRLLARRYGSLVRVKNHFFGSGTAHNR